MEENSGERLEQREATPEEVSDARLEDFEALTRLYEPPSELSADGRMAVQTTSPLVETLTCALRALAQTQLESLCLSP